MSKNAKTPAAAAAATLVQTTSPSGATITSTPDAAPLPHTVFGPTDTAALQSYAVSLDRKFGSADLLTDQISEDASALALLLIRLDAGKEFSCYCTARQTYIDALAGKSAEAAARSWQRAYAAARDTKQGASLPKGGPASSAPEAQRKAEARATAKNAAATDTRTPAQLKAEAIKVGSTGDFKAAAKLQALAEQKIKAADRAAKEAAHEATKSQADQIRAAIKRLQDAGNVAALAALLKLALKHSPEPAPAKV